MITAAQFRRGIAAVLSVALTSWPQCGWAASAPRDVAQNHQYLLGPLTFLLGPESDGYFGATLTGSKSISFAAMSSLPSVSNLPQGSIEWVRYGTLDLSMNAAWSSAPTATNNATISLSPSITLDAVRVATADRQSYARTVTPEEQLVCNKLSSDYGKALAAGNTERADDIAGRSRANCPKVIDPYSDIAAISLFPTFEYRYGHFTERGKKYEANQALIGAGARLFFPWRVGHWLASWPYLSVTYYHAKDSSSSNIPVPEGIKTDFIQADENAIVFLPIQTDKAGDRLELSVDMAASKATAGETRKWQYLTTVQLIANVGGSWKPALTYREGRQHGFQYDKQVILGVATNFLGN